MSFLKPHESMPMAVAIAAAYGVTVAIIMIRLYLKFRRNMRQSLNRPLV